MPVFLFFALLFLAALVGSYWSLVALATRRLKEQTRRHVRRIALGLGVLGTTVYCYLVVLLLDAHFDTEDFWSPSEQTQLQEYTEACEGPLAPGTSVEDVHTWLADSGILSVRDPKHSEKRVAFRESKSEDTNSHRIEIRDRNVRNWNIAGDIDVATYVSFEAGRVSRCNATISKHGR